jgi:hypothetical protein
MNSGVLSYDGIVTWGHHPGAYEEIVWFPQERAICQDSNQMPPESGGSIGLDRDTRGLGNYTGFDGVSSRLRVSNRYQK